MDTIPNTAGAMPEAPDGYRSIGQIPLRPGETATLVYCLTHGAIHGEEGWLCDKALIASREQPNVRLLHCRPCEIRVAVPETPSVNLMINDVHSGAAIILALNATSEAAALQLVDPAQLEDGPAHIAIARDELIKFAEAILVQLEPSRLDRRTTP